jgi:hypothetical protein
MAKKKKKKKGRLKPRGASQYDNKTHGKGDSTMPPDDRTVKTNLCRVNVLRPKFKDGPMFFRPWPALAYEDPDTLANGRASTESRGQSHWIVRVPVAKYIGLNDPSCEKVTFCTRLPWDQDGKRNNPFSVLSYGAHDAHDAGKFGPGRKWDSEWNRFLKGKSGKGAELSKPTASWFAQGIVFANGDKDYTSGRDLPLGMDENDALVVVQMSTSAGGKVLDLLDVPKKGFDGDAEERPWEAFKYGDPTGVYDAKAGTVKGGVILVLFNPEKTKSIKKNTTWDPDAKQDSFKGYEAAVRLSYKGADGDKFPAQLREQDVENVFARSQFWFDEPDGGEQGLIYVPSIEEQCVLIAKAFRSCPKLITFAWADHEDEFLTDDVMGILNARKSAVMPAEDEDTDDDDFEDEEPAKKKRSRKDPTQSKAKATATAEEDEFEDDDDEPAAADDDEFEDEDEESEAEAEDTDDDEFEDDEESKGEVEAEDDGDDEYPDDVDDDEEEVEEEGDDDDYFEEDDPTPDTEEVEEEEVEDDDEEEAKMRASLEEAKKRGGSRGGKKKKKKTSKPATEKPKKKKRVENPAEKKKKKKKKKKS